tara:strand:+ start:29 stop:202 length:174 start_codon:yes stop_codon:yes gene_type:complete
MAVLLFLLFGLLFFVLGELGREAKLVLKDGVPEPAWILGTLDEATKVIDNKGQDKNE